MIDDIIARLQGEDVEISLDKTELTIYFKDGSYIEVTREHNRSYVDEDLDGNEIYGTEHVPPQIIVSTPNQTIVLFPEDGEYKQIYKAVVDRVKSYFTIK